jgi:hypothetical protein
MFIQASVRRRKILPASAALLTGALTVACNPSRSDPSSHRGDVDVAESSAPSAADSDPNPLGSGDGLLIGGAGDPLGGPDDGSSVDDACISNRAEAELIVQPVDVIVVVDNSGSMDDEVQAIEDNLNVNFASILAESGIDYRVILISRHADSDADDTSVCIESPLSGLAHCTADAPVFSERFFQYSTEVGSRNSFDVLLETLAPPLGRDEEFGNAPLGWSDWLRVGARKIFLEVSDDDENMSPLDFLFSLTELAPEHFGAPDNPNLVWHSIVGIAEKASPTEPYLPDEPVESEECTGNDNGVVNAGGAYQELSRLTGGLRFPICQFDAYDAVFQTIAKEVLQSGSLACDFAIPEAPAGVTLDLGKVAVSYTPGDGSEARLFGQVANSALCQADAFFAADDLISLCPQACDLVRADSRSALDVLFTCKSTLIVH